MSSDDEPSGRGLVNLSSQNSQAFFEELRNNGTGLPMPSSFPTPEDVRSESHSRSTKILESWSLLRNIIERHEATIQKRWTKKTKDKRKEVLLGAWPNMAHSHRPDFEAFKTKSMRSSEETKRDAYLWPYVDLEDLLKPKLLLLLLNSRGRHRPDAFARADFDACHFGITSQAISRPFLNEYVMMFAGRQTPETYGELISWDSHPEAFNWMSSQRGFVPGDGLCVLEIQERLYGFLVDCCKSILHEIPEAALADPSLPVQPEPPSVASNDVGMPSLATLAAEAPYKLPSDLDLKRLLSIVTAKFSAAKDHIWALREDPGYFAERLIDQAEHRQECLPGISGDHHPVLQNPRQRPIFWQRVIGNLVLTAIGNLENWGTLERQLRGLLDMQERYKGSISADKDLPEDYASAFYQLKHHLSQYVKAPIGVLRQGFVASPPMRPFFERKFDDPTPMLAVAKRSGLSKDKVRDELIWIFMTLFDENQLFLARLNTLVDELERLIESDGKAKELISFWVADAISDLSVLSQCMHQIDLYQPWAATFETEMASRDKELKEDYDESTKPMMAVFRNIYGGAVTSLGTPTDGKFSYPVNRRRTRENVNQMREAENHLDVFWRAVDRRLISSNAVTPQLARLLPQRDLRRTPEYKEPLKENKQLSAGVEELVKPLSEIYLERELLSEGTVVHDNVLANSKTKPKTRGIARRPDSTVQMAENLVNQQQDIQPTFKVDKRALKVFKTLFFIPSISAQPGEVAWGDFLHAMTSTGFSAEKLYGSVWQFTPAKLDVERAIQFHEPHPSGKISFAAARRHGRRLNRAYGWHGGMFALE